MGDNSTRGLDLAQVFVKQMSDSQAELSSAASSIVFRRLKPPNFARYRQFNKIWHSRGPAEGFWLVAPRELYGPVFSFVLVLQFRYQQY